VFLLPDLSYEYDALGPYISSDIMELHHKKHHQAYVDKLNAALEGRSEFADWTVERLLSELSALPEELRTTVRNNAGGHYNHSLFWQWLSPNGGGQPGGELEQAIVARYGTFQEFVDNFTTQASGVFGSGWVWLQPNMDIITTPNQDSPLTTDGEAPLLGLDVWEHAYYLDYKNRRPEYIEAWWNIVNWDFVRERYEKSL